MIKAVKLLVRGYNKNRGTFPEHRAEVETIKDPCRAALAALLAEWLPKGCVRVRVYDCDSKLLASVPHSRK